MTYFNRKNQLFRTLLSISESKLKNDCEIVIVDDGSSEDQKIDFLDEFELNVKLIEIKKEDKWYVNPCIPFNIGFKNASYDTVIIQNAECLHSGDILKHVTHLPENAYWVYSVHSLTQPQTKQLDTIDWKTTKIHNVLENIPLLSCPISFDGGPGWYQHPVHRPVNYHFISAIKKKKLDLIGGFNEKFASGIGWEDNEFIRKVSKNLYIVPIVKPFGFHQWHYDHIWDKSKVKQDNHSLFLSLK